jgi:hypothetical protein
MIALQRDVRQAETGTRVSEVYRKMVGSEYRNSVA